MQSIFNKIKQTNASGKSYWMSRDLCVTLGYSDYSKFKKVIDKAEDLCQTNNQNKDDHFAHVSNMIQVGKGASRKVENIKLSQYACLLIAMQADGKKDEVKLAKEYFSGKIETEQNLDIRENADIILAVWKEIFEWSSPLLHWAITGQTAAEIFYTHADATKIWD